MRTPDFYLEALALLGLPADYDTVLTPEQHEQVDALEADLRAEDGWARLDWLDANPGLIGL